MVSHPVRMGVNAFIAPRQPLFNRCLTGSRVTALRREVFVRLCGNLKTKTMCGGTIQIGIEIEIAIQIDVAIVIEYSRSRFR